MAETLTDTSADVGARSEISANANQQPRPKDYTPRAFARALWHRLTPQECQLVTNPLAYSTPMAAFAREVTASAKGDLQRARTLYDRVIDRTSTNAARFQSPPSALEAFGAWTSGRTDLTCQDLATLYVSLARAARLRAYLVVVDEDYRGIRLLHTCAAVYIRGAAVLVDPAYLRFDVPHRKFALLDDLEATALFLCGKQEVRACKIGCKLAPRLGLVHASLFQALVRESRWEEAAQQMRELIGLDPEGLMAYYCRAITYTKEGKLEKAADLLNQALASAPETDVLYFQLGIVCWLQGDVEKARRAYQKALRYATYQPCVNAAEKALASLDALGDGSGAPLLYSRGSAMQTRGDLRGALTNYNQAIALDPRFAEAYVARGMIRQMTGEQEAALADYDRAIELKPQMQGLYYYRASARHASGDLAGALQDYNKALELSPDLAEAYAGRSLIREANGQNQEALTDFRRAVELKPGMQAQLYYDRGRLRQGRGELKGALEDYDKAVESSPATPEAYLARAMLKQTQGDLRPAIADYTRAINLRPGFAEVYAYRGYARHMQGDVQGAVGDYERALSLGSSLGTNEIPVHLMLAVAQYDGGKFAEALTHLRRACDLGCVDPYVRLLIWVTGSRLGDQARASQELQSYLSSRAAAEEDRWPLVIGNFLLGRTAEDDLLKAAEQGSPPNRDERLCQANFYAGVKRLLAGDEPGAAAHFRACASSQARDLPEFLNALAELRRKDGNR